MSATWAVVPLKGAPSAKSRLAEGLGAAERADLARHMAEDVLAALGAARGVDGIALLAPPGVAAEVAAGGPARAAAGLRVLHDDPAAGLNGNLDAAAALLAREGAGALLVVHADLPLLAAADVESLLAAHRAAAAQGPAVTLAPAARDGGTNGLALSPPAALPCRFGADSARRHREAAARLGIRCTSVDLPGFARDVDTMDDVAWLCATPGGGHTRRYLAASGLCDRLERARPADPKP